MKPERRDKIFLNKIVQAHIYREDHKEDVCPMKYLRGFEAQQAPQKF